MPPSRTNNSGLPSISMPRWKRSFPEFLKPRSICCWVKRMRRKASHRVGIAINAANNDPAPITERTLSIQPESRSTDGSQFNARIIVVSIIITRASGLAQVLSWYVSRNISPLSQSRNSSLLVYALYSSVWHRTIAVISRLNAESCSIWAFCRPEFMRAFR